MITPQKQGRLKPFIEFMQEDDSKEVARMFSLRKIKKQIDKIQDSVEKGQK